MARPRSAVYTVEGESRRPGIHRDWVTGQCHHLNETVLQRALMPNRRWPRPGQRLTGARPYRGRMAHRPVARRSLLLNMRASVGTSPGPTKVTLSHQLIVIHSAP